VATLTWTGANGSMELPIEEETTIGRTPQNTITLSDPRLSKTHARIVLEGDAWILHDEASQNGTFVNSKRQSVCRLADGDVVRLGPVELVFHEGDPGASVAPGPTRAATATTDDDDDDFFFDPGSEDFDRASQDGRDVLTMHALDAASVQKMQTPSSADDKALSRRLAAGFAISRATAATLDLSEMLGRVLEALFDIFGGAERGYVLLAEPGSDEVQVAASRRRDAAQEEEISISSTALKQVLSRREALLCMDAAADARFSSAVSVADYGIRSMMLAPLLFRDQVFGAIHIDTLDRFAGFTEADLELLAFAATQVAGAVANTELHNRLVETARMAAVGETVAGLSHCVRNLLQCIRAGAFLVEGGLEKSELASVRTGWEIVTERHALMEELVLDLLQYAKPRKPHYELVDINELCEKTCTAGADSRQMDITVQFHPDPALHFVEIDPKGIRRCLLNFVTNALDACASGGSVTVETHLLQNEGLVQIVVADTGCGMSKDTKAKLFKQFFSTKGAEGTGLGLTLSKKIIEEHGGRIQAQSSEGEGATFTVSLPATRAGRN